MSDTIHLSTPGKIQDLPVYSGKTQQGFRHNNATINASIGGATEMFIFIGIVIFLLLLQLSRILKPSSRIHQKRKYQPVRQV
jgi:hypothetical protein